MSTIMTILGGHGHNASYLPLIHTIKHRLKQMHYFKMGPLRHQKYTVVALFHYNYSAQLVSTGFFKSLLFYFPQVIVPGAWYFFGLASGEVPSKLTGY